MARFLKLLTKTDIQKRLSLATKCSSLSHHLKGAMSEIFQATDEIGFVWTFQCSIRKKGHPKPVLSKSWLAFLRHKKLKVGDKIKFWKEKNQPFSKVQAEKKSRYLVSSLGIHPL